MSYELIALLMFASMMLSLMTGQRVFVAIGIVGVVASLVLWGTGGSEIGFSAAMKLMKWYPLLTLPLFIFMGYMLSESGIADDLYKMFHVWMGPIHGGLAIGTILLMVVISAMNGLSVAGMAIGATIALPELLKRGYDKIMVTGGYSGWQLAWYFSSAKRGHGALCHDCKTTRWQALACRRFSRLDDGGIIYYLYRCSL